MKATRLLLLALCCAHLSASANSQVPALISYQGHLTDSTGQVLGAPTPLNRTVTFRIWNNPTSTDAANRLYSESQMVTFVNGEFSVNLGTGTPVSGETNPSSLAEIWTSKDMFLGITVDDGDPATVDPELAPRQQIVTTAFAFRAKHAETADIAKRVENGAITQDMLANNSVTIHQIADHSIHSNQDYRQQHLARSTSKMARLCSMTSAPMRSTTQKLSTKASIAKTLKMVRCSSMTSPTMRSIVTELLIIVLAVRTYSTTASTHQDIHDGQITLEDLAAAVRDDSLCPMGTILSYAGDHAPAGWIMCHGQHLDRGQYAALFAVIGTRFGHGNGSTSFNAPDLRGVFLRGRDAGKGMDADRGAPGHPSHWRRQWRQRG